MWLARIQGSDPTHLNKWDKGNFENAVDAHNKILALQDGTIGVATRLLTPEEEQEFIEQHFR